MRKDAAQTIHARGTPNVAPKTSRICDLDWHSFPNIHFSVPEAANQVSCTLNAMEMTVGHVCTLAIAWRKHRANSKATWILRY